MYLILRGSVFGDLLGLLTNLCHVVTSEINNRSRVLTLMPSTNIVLLSKRIKIIKVLQAVARGAFSISFSLTSTFLSRHQFVLFV